MASSLDFRIEVLINSLQEFQKEKENLEFRYKEAKTRRKNQESKLDNVTEKCYQSKEKYMKMQETVNIAYQRVSQNQTQGERLKQQNEEKRSAINNLSKQLQEQEKKDNNQMRCFEDKLFEIAERFRNSKDYFQENNVRKETEQWKKQSVDAVAQVKDLECTLEEFRRKMQSLDLENEKEKDKLLKTLKFGITPEELIKAQNVFSEINKEASDSLVQVESELKKEETILKSLENEVQRVNLPGEGFTGGQTQQVVQSRETADVAFDIPEVEQSSTAAESRDILLDKGPCQTSFNSNMIGGTETPDEVSVSWTSVQHTANNGVSQTANTLPTANVNNKTQEALEIQNPITSFRNRPFFISSPFSKRNKN